MMLVIIMLMVTMILVYHGFRRFAYQYFLLNCSYGSILTNTSQIFNLFWEVTDVDDHESDIGSQLLRQWQEGGVLDSDDSEEIEEVANVYV